MKTETIQIDGMSCGHCVRAVREALEETEGVTVDNVAIGTATVRFEGDRGRLVEAIEDAGYAVPDSA